MGSFVSGITRSSFDAKGADSREKLLIRQRMKKSQQAGESGDALDSKSLILLDATGGDLKAPSIGPGSYYNERLASSIRLQAKPVELQNFGSSSHRFAEKTVGFKTLGPGKYEPKPPEATVSTLGARLNAYKQENGTVGLCALHVLQRTV